MRGTRGGPRRIVVVAALAAGMAAGSCAYAPDFQNGLLVCGDLGQCPKGYACAADNTCWKTGAASPTSFDAFLGTWDFSSGSLIATCSDGSSVNRGLTSDDFIILDNSGGTLLLAYYCDNGWSMRVSGGNTSAAVAPNQTCTEQTSDTLGIVTTYEWSARSLTFSTSDGSTATSAGHLAGPFSDTLGVTGTCDVMFSGALTKNLN